MSLCSLQPVPITIYSGGGIENHSVTVYVTAETPVTFTVEEGSTLSQLTGFTEPTLDGYTYIGLYTAEGEEFKMDTPVTSDITIYAKFSKTNTTTDEETGAVTTETTVKNTDGSETTTKSTKTTEEDGSVVTETSTTTKDSTGSSSTVTVKETVTKNEDGSTTTTTETTENGKTTKVEKVETEKEDGTVEVVTTTTDADGNTTKETTTEDATQPAQYWIKKGINALVSQNAAYPSAITEAKADFEKAYEVEPSSDEAKVYSALANIADLSANETMAEFFRKHLGILNYPTDFGTFLKGDWLSKGTYVQGSSLQLVNAYTFEPAEIVDDSQYDRPYYFKASKVESDSEQDIYGAQYVKTTIPSAEEKYVRVYDEQEYLYNKDGFTSGLFGGESFVRNYYESVYVKLDNEGDCIVEVWGNAKEYKDKGYTPYALTGSGQVFYTYDYRITAPKFNTTFSDNWINVGTEPSINFGMLVLANALEGNTNGLNGAIDDLYTAIYESKSYTAAVEKIQSVKTGVTVPSKVSEVLGLGEVWGNADIVLGKPELTLIVSVFNAYKAVIEYLQSYNFDTDLSVLKTDWNDFSMDFVTENFSRYNAKIDPIANGFLTVRSADKIASSKETLISVIDDVLAAYESITGANSAYPSVVKEFLNGEDGIGALVKDGVASLKTALSNGTKWYFPIEWVSENKQPASWPTSGESWIDVGKVFTAGTFSIENILELETVDGVKQPVFYKMAETRTGPEGEWNFTFSKADAVKISTKDEYLDLLAEQQVDSEDGMSSTQYRAALKFTLFDTLKSVTTMFPLPLESDGSTAIPYGTIPTEIGAFIFNFYNNGCLNEEIEKMMSGSGGE